MPTTPNLGLTHVAPGQSAKPTTVNGMADGLDEAIAGLTERDCSAGGTITLSLTEWSNMVLHLTGAPGAGFNIVVPTNKKIYIVDNTSGQSATVKTAAGSGILVATGAVRILRCDGTNIVAVV
jgi:hypothetical protein